MGCLQHPADRESSPSLLVPRMMMPRQRRSHPGLSAALVRTASEVWVMLIRPLW